MAWCFVASRKAGSSFVEWVMICWQGVCMLGCQMSGPAAVSRRHRLEVDPVGANVSLQE